MIKQKTAAKIWNAYREIETAEKLLNEISESKGESLVNETAPTIKDAFGRQRFFQMGIPSGNDSQRLFQVKPELAESVIRAHIENKKAELAEANEQARIELNID